MKTTSLLSLLRAGGVCVTVGLAGYAVYSQSLLSIWPWPPLVLFACLVPTALATRAITELEATQESQRQNHAGAIRQFSTRISDITTMLSASTTQLKSNAQSLSHIAEETNQQAASVAATSEQVTANVSQVAAAAEQLTTSIKNISQEVTASRKTAGQAVDQAAQTSQTVAAMSHAVQKVGDVLQIIAKIAHQTNLLALNATIEAARAGEAGKGFAVVAGEVKNLAAQTAKATQEIGAEITNIQSVAQETVLSIQAISDTIKRMNQVSQTIDVAVGSQADATTEISKNVQEVAGSNQSVSSSIRTVSLASAESGEVADQVLTGADNMDKLAHQLSDAVAEYVRAVQTSVA